MINAGSVLRTFLNYEHHTCVTPANTDAVSQQPQRASNVAAEDSNSHNALALPRSCSTNDWPCTCVQLSSPSCVSLRSVDCGVFFCFVYSDCSSVCVVFVFPDPGCQIVSDVSLWRLLTSFAWFLTLLFRLPATHLFPWLWFYLPRIFWIWIGLGFFFIKHMLLHQIPRNYAQEISGTLHLYMLKFPSRKQK